MSTIFKRMDFLEVVLLSKLTYTSSNCFLIFITAVFPAPELMNYGKVGYCIVKYPKKNL